jgi:aminoglycoside 2''-phosphotransferase
MESRTCANLIQECFPRILVRRYGQIQSGWDNLVLEINKEYVFRFPRFEQAERHLLGEIAFLPFLSGSLSIAVPFYEFVWKGDKRHPRKFAGYRKIEGVPITRRVLKSASTESLADDIAHFLSELHHIRTSQKSFRNVRKFSTSGWTQHYQKTRQKVRKLVYPLLGKDTLTRAEILWEELIETLLQSTFDPVLVHGDLTRGNILVDPSKLMLTGIIDWSDAMVGDPALDLAGLFDVDPSLGEQVLRCYGRRGELFRTRIEHYVKAIPFYEILWGMAQGSDAHIAIALRRIRSRLNRDSKL